MEKHLVHGEGDYFGKPFRLRTWQRSFIYRAYELHPNGTRSVDRALLGIPKGNGKTELAAAIGCAELGGPVVCAGFDKNGRPVAQRRISPDIPVAAASFEQADKLFGAVRTMIKHGPLKPYFDVFDTEVLIKGGEPGRMYRVAAVAGTNDGGLPTFVLADELHEWTGNKARVHVVLANGRAKRANSWELNISTAGWDIASLLGLLVKHGKRVLSGEVTDPGFLFAWYEFVEKLDAKGAKIPLNFADEIALAAAIREANPAADDFLNVQARVKRAAEIPEYEFRRYYLNQWVDAPDQWLPTGAWDSCADPSRQPPADGADVVLFLDGTYDGQSAGIVGATLEPKPHLFVVHSWEKGVAPQWKGVTIAELEDALRSACEKWSVLRIGMDPSRWRSTIARLEENGLPVVAWESHLPSRMVPACAQLYDAVKELRLSHDGHKQMAQHVANAIVKIDSRGPRIAKEHADSDRHIDLAVGAIGVYDLAVRGVAGSDEWRPVE